jgi:NAD-dependent dihydropyrimidine dehydrogenase PreA subunit
VKGFRYLKNVSTLRLDRDACVGCGRCVEVCPHQVFVLSENLADIADLDACMECGACAMNCPVDTIRVEAGVGCAAGLINEWLRERKIRGGSGGCCS